MAAELRAILDVFMLHPRHSVFPAKTVGQTVVVALGGACGLVSGSRCPARMCRKISTLALLNCLTLAVLAWSLASPWTSRNATPDTWCAVPGVWLDGAHAEQRLYRPQTSQAASVAGARGCSRWRGTADFSKAFKGVAVVVASAIFCGLSAFRCSGRRDYCRARSAAVSLHAAPRAATTALDFDERDLQGSSSDETVDVYFEGVSWTPAVAGAGENGRSSTKEVLKSVTWGLRGRERVGLIGANGCGKSTQLLMIQGLVEPSGGEISLVPPREKMRIAYMQQEADLEGNRTVEEELRSVFTDRSLDAIDADIERCAASSEEAALDVLDDLIDERTLAEQHLDEVDAILPKLGLCERRGARIPELSGGWQMRVAIGKIILDRPDLLLLDEPTNHIDLETVEFMENFLRQQPVAMVIVSHDRYFLNQVCTKIVDTYKGRARSYRGNYVAYLKKRDETLAQEWRRYQKYVEQVQNAKKQVKRLEEKLILTQARAKRLKLEALLAEPVPQPEVVEISGFRFPCSVAAETSTLEATDEDASVVVDVDSQLETDESAAPAEGTAEPAMFKGSDHGFHHHHPPVMLEVKDLHVSFDDRPVLRGVDFTVRQGEKVVVVGRNGCGKSTLVRAVMDDLGESGKHTGSVMTTEEGVAYFPQRLAEAFNYERGSVKDALYMSCGVEEIEAAGGLPAVLRRLRLDGVTKDQPVCSLSGGEKARVAFAQFLLQPCALLILDEPTNHLDIPTRELLEDALKAFEGAAVVVSHDRFFLREFATRVVEVLEDGTLVDHGDWEAYSNAAPPQWHAATDAEVDFVKQDAQAAVIWGRKKMARLKKRIGNVGLRRLSKRTHEFMDQVPADPQHGTKAKQVERPRKTFA